MNDELNDMIQISCEETITPDIEAQLEMTEQPTHKEVAGVCEDAPCCGCCGDSTEDGDGSPADDAWHDANEYPDW